MNWFSVASFIPQMMQDALRHTEKCILLDVGNIRVYMFSLYNRYLQLELGELREEVSMTDMLNDRMCSFQKNTEVTIKHASYFPACGL